MTIMPPLYAVTKGLIGNSLVALAAAGAFCGGGFEVDRFDVLFFVVK
jgi:hypothetical protein